MFRSSLTNLARTLSSSLRSTTTRSFGVSAVCQKDVETVRKGAGEEVSLSHDREMHQSEELTQRYVAFFRNPHNDGWMARGAMNDLLTHPVLPEPEVTIEVLHSCRRMDDFALAVRYLESLKHIMYDDVNKVWPWYKQEIEPTLKELGIPAPEDMGYDKPELYTVNPEDIH